MTTTLDLPADLVDSRARDEDAARPARNSSATVSSCHLFLLPLLYEKGGYVLRNIRLVSADVKTLQTAVPSFANITITQTLTTKLRVHRLTPDELRARGITV
ncbi:MAG TPA: hypothetical protein VHX14_12430, partial [Thermoanaerobaculia bacterium]|nr:hypothetical protein [Thermoanaerobaculia bacterium]